MSTTTIAKPAVDTLDDIAVVTATSLAADAILASIRADISAADALVLACEHAHAAVRIGSKVPDIAKAVGKSSDTVWTYVHTGAILALPVDADSDLYDDRAAAWSIRRQYNAAFNAPGVTRPMRDRAIRQSGNRDDAVAALAALVTEAKAKAKAKAAKAATPEVEVEVEGGTTPTVDQSTPTRTDAGRLLAIRAILSGMTGDGTVDPAVLAALEAAVA